MGLVNVVGFCSTDFPDGTTGSVPCCWAWAALREPARTSDPTDTNRTDGNFNRSNFFMRLSPCTQLTVTRRRYGRTLSLSRTKWRFGGPADESCQAERVTLHAPGQHPAVAAVKRGQRRVAILSQDRHAPDLPAAPRPLPPISSGPNISRARRPRRAPRSPVRRAVGCWRRTRRPRHAWRPGFRCTARPGTPAPRRCRWWTCRSKGGSDTARNLRLLCEPCNRRKSDRI